MDPKIRLHRNQFVIGPRPRPMALDWLATSVGGSWLSHCPDLRVGRAVDADGGSWTLIGLATQTRGNLPDPLAHIARVVSSDVPAAYEHWAGRWLLIGDDEVHLDAMGLLGCHWVKTIDGETWASSSPRALADLDGVGEPTATALHYERGLSWIVPPLGRRRPVSRLLPSQILNLGQGTTRVRRLVTPAIELESEGLGASGHAPGRLLAGVAAALGESVRRLPIDEPKQLALTAGADSRLVLASVTSTGGTIATFTRRTARMSVADRLIPPRLAARIGVAHREIGRHRADPERSALARLHTDDHVSAGDALPFIEAARDGFVGFEIGGQGFGAGKVKDRRFPASIDDPDELAAMVGDHAGEPEDSPNRRSLAAWLSVVADQHETQPAADVVDWRDRLYLEQRMGGWQSSKEQLYDLHGHRRFFPINAARTLGMLLAIDEVHRRDGAHQIEMIRLLDERLLAEPFNPPGRSFGVMRRVGHRLRVDPARVVTGPVSVLQRASRS